MNDKKVPKTQKREWVMGLVKAGKRQPEKEHKV